MMVSVIVPTYRRDWELVRAIASLAGQVFTDFEVIVVDDNCDRQWNDKIKSIIEESCATYTKLNIVYICNMERLGSALARNVGVQAAKGTYVTFLDDDDEYLPEKIERQLAFMVENQLDYSITDLDLLYENGKTSEHRDRRYIKKTDRQSLLKYHFMYHMTGTDTIMLTKSFYEKIGGFPPIDVGDEFYLMLSAIEEEGRFGYLPVCDVRAYVHTGEGGLSSGEQKIAGQTRIYEFKKNYFHLLDRASVRYIKMRHYAVLCFAGIRMGNYWYFLKYGVLSVISAPIQCVRMLYCQNNQRSQVEAKVSDEQCL